MAIIDVSVQLSVSGYIYRLYGRSYEKIKFSSDLDSEVHGTSVLISLRGFLLATAMATSKPRMISLLGTGSLSGGEHADIVIIDSGPISMTGSMDGTVNGKEASQGLISFRGDANLYIQARSASNSGKIILDANAFLNIKSQSTYINSFVSMYGFLSLGIAGKVRTPCFDEILAFNDFVLDFKSSCIIDKGEQMAITRYKDDNYPIQMKISTNGNSNIDGYVFEMKTKVGTNQEYVSTGTNINPYDGEVVFDLDPLALANAGSGEYVIIGNDGSYNRTYTKGPFIILDNTL